MTDKWMDEVGSDVLKAVDDGVERCSLIALASLSSRGVWGFAVKFTSLIEKLSCFIKRDKKEIENLFFWRPGAPIDSTRERQIKLLSLSLSLSRDRDRELSIDQSYPIL